MRDVLPFLAFLVFAVIIVLLMLVVSRRSAAIREMLMEVANTAGWTNLETVSFIGSGVKGMWRQFPVELVYRQRQKGVPQRFVLKVTAQSDRYLNIKRKFDGFFSNRPLTWFGAPVIDVHQPSASQMWVRGDASLGERLFADANVASLIATNLIARFDEIRVDGSGLRVTRAIDERIVRTRYNMPGFTMTFDPKQFAVIAREEIALAEAMVGRL